MTAMTNDETIEQLNHMKAFIGYDEDNHLVKRMQSALDRAIQALKERPTAHFIRYINHNYSPFDNSPEYIMKCSNCGCVLSEGAFYCPTCGAKMEEGKWQNNSN